MPQQRLKWKTDLEKGVITANFDRRGWVRAAENDSERMAMSDKPYIEVRKKLKELVTNGVLKEAISEDGTIKYYLP